MMRNRGLIMIMIIATLVIWKGFDVSAKEDSDAQWLLSLSNQVMEGNQKVLIKQFSPYSIFTNEDDFVKTAAELSTAFALPVNGQITHAEDHLAYKTEASIHDVRFSLLYIGMMQDRSSSLVLSLKTDNDTGLAHILELQEELEHTMAALGIPIHWNVMVQGELQGDHSEGNKFLEWLPDTLDAKEVERYADHGTVSVSYFSRDLQTRLLTGDRQMNIQAAVHEDSVTGKQRVTLGIPVITTEY
ncbi:MULTISPECIES: YwmB family TATA-box binding protein [unclassified Paenibacillus]|uniref:YwmB family TATA-box binding protein n=1 Tax=unclassified Paenibacillus TaxID=185978 RepID=UPI001AE91A71|nr:MULTISPECIES: YwmB family TATA-box binding protein [unclassified Paenibacillus]MBP1153791.1 hypothetical protein [Paenibacillus sp. PvP091]MBP1170824.1 hypothetical protein [Paenibacillus sp. PvR098]MBP2441852.1 hypothetical protein [Paenibacillus sp. PvP052]